MNLAFFLATERAIDHRSPQLLPYAVRCVSVSSVLSVAILLRSLFSVALVSSQGIRRIDKSSPTRRNPARQHRDDHQCQRRGGQRQRVTRRNAEQERSN